MPAQLPLLTSRQCASSPQRLPRGCTLIARALICPPPLQADKKNCLECGQNLQRCQVGFATTSKQLEQQRELNKRLQEANGKLQEQNQQLAAQVGGEHHQTHTPTVPAGSPAPARLRCCCILAAAPPSCLLSRQPC